MSLELGEDGAAEEVQKRGEQRQLAVEPAVDDEFLVIAIETHEDDQSADEDDELDPTGPVGDVPREEHQRPLRMPMTMAGRMTAMVATAMAMARGGGRGRRGQRRRRHDTVFVLETAAGRRDGGVFVVFTGHQGGGMERGQGILVRRG